MWCPSVWCLGFIARIGLSLARLLALISNKLKWPVVHCCYVRLATAKTRGTISFFSWLILQFQRLYWCSAVLGNPAWTRLFWSGNQIDKWRESGPNLEPNPFPPDILRVHIVNPSSAEWIGCWMDHWQMSKCVSRLTLERCTQSTTRTVNMPKVSCKTLRLIGKSLSGSAWPSASQCGDASNCQTQPKLRQSTSHN